MSANPHVEAAREGARQSDGKFGPFHHSESTVKIATGSSEDPSTAQGAFAAAGGYTEGDFFAIDSVQRDDQGKWTIEFSTHEDRSHQTGETMTATYSESEGYRQDQTSTESQWHEMAAPGRNDSDAFAKDLLGCLGGQEREFFERAELEYREANDMETR